MEEHTEGTRLISGSNCYFDYGKAPRQNALNGSQSKKSLDPPLDHPSSSRQARHEDKASESKSSTKKKNKKKKNKSSAAAKLSVNDVSFVDPDADYPESRLIKVGPDGDLIVESLDDEYPRQNEGSLASKMVPPVPSIPRKLAQKVLALDSDQQSFWDGMSSEAQKQMFTIDASAIFSSMCERQKEIVPRHNELDRGHDHSWAHNPNSKCFCSRCGRNGLQVVNSINEGFATYMGELMEGLWEQFELQYHDLKPETKFIDVSSAEDVLHDKYIEAQNIQRFAEIKQIATAGANAGESPSTVQNLELFYYIENIIIPMIQREFTTQALTTRLSPWDRRSQFDTLSCVHQILRLIQSINDRTRLLRETKGEPVHPSSPKEVQRMAVADNLIDCLYSFSKEGPPGIWKAMEFVKILSRVGRAEDNQFPDVTEQMSQFADMFESDDKAFIDLVAKWKSTEPSDALLNGTKQEEEIEDEADEAEIAEDEHYALKNPFSHCKCDFHSQLSHQFESARSKALDNGHENDCLHEYEEEEDDEEDEEDLDEDYDEDYDEEHDCGHDHHDSEDYEDDIDESGTDEEEAEERRFKELRGFLFMEARNIILKRFQDSYKKRVSDDRTKKFIEELEAEESAKKEKELKKLRQKEKQKEKKRLQVLEQEEKRKKKEAEEQEKAALVKKKQDDLRAEQKRRDEELKLKKEKEKLKKIEALKQKEIENRLNAEKILEKNSEKNSEISVPVKGKQTIESLDFSEEKKNSHDKKTPVKGVEAKLVNGSATKITEKAISKAPSAKGTPAKTEKASKPSNASVNSQKTGPVSTLPAVSSLGKKAKPRQTSGVDPQDILPISEQPVRQEADSGKVLSPKNHSMEQLYHSRPKTVSTSSGDAIDFLKERGSASLMGTGYSPSKKSISAYQTGSINNVGSGPLKSESMISLTSDGPPLMQSRDGSASTWGLKNPQDVPNTPALAAPMMSGLPSSSLWSYHQPTRNQSIWGSGGSTNADSSALNIWGPPATRSEVTNAGTILGSSKESVQSATFRAIQDCKMIDSTNDDTAPAMKIFKAAKSILGDHSLKMSEFLSALHSSVKYQFEIVYDDFGSVTDIKASVRPESVFGGMSLTDKSPSPQQAQIPPLFQSQPIYNQLDTGLNFHPYAPNPLPTSQTFGQHSFSHALPQDPFQIPSGPFQPAIPAGAAFPHNPPPMGHRNPSAEGAIFQPGSLRGSSENVNQFDSKISETMQGSLNQLGIGQARSGIW